ncbi:protein of unknown function [endosymbiont DhMRE of Dentiscutata heterogama]|uniref:type II toxin-antitoxin system CcdA family antitoxin n=1 Tax=endosymbiont DhMRE of Dentiscutata heterogama TaxID=1609546 RepID=UPI0006329FD1|nr:type II toxin-antitoxin system CcdA family antitoxin [endosymbiont DhMRE of Dentiscutata heterogama]CFW92711.1 protein of unknown function [endosymbiont DhMRE of Dentiscutata heterogama]
MTGKNANIYFSEKTYDKLRQVAGSKISRFVNEAVEEKIQREKQQEKQEFQQKLIADYQSIASSKKRQAEDEIWDETLNDAWEN